MGGNYSDGTAEIEAGAAAYWRWQTLQLVSHFCFCFLSVCSEVTTDEDRVTPEPIIPEEIEVEVNYEPDPTDLVLSSVPGGELFDPRKHKFSEDDLKPQPMIKKAKKVFVPDEQKVCWQLDEEDHKKNALSV